MRVLGTIKNLRRYNNIGAYNEFIYLPMAFNGSIKQSVNGP